MALTVGQVAKLSGVSVRALHHYEAIGLLAPSARTVAGYRLYGDADLQRLQQILFFRELGFSLEQIGRTLSDPGFDLRAALTLQRQLLAEKEGRVRALVAAVDKALASLDSGVTMSKEEMFEVFGDVDPTQHEDEVKERWGETDAYQESARRTKQYRKEDWQRIKAEGDANLQAFAAALDAGRAPDHPAVMALAEEARQHIHRWFYPCSPAMHRDLAELYVADPRFTATYEQVRPGLAQFVRDAIVANADRQAGLKA